MRPRRRTRFLVADVAVDRIRESAVVARTAPEGAGPSSTTSCSDLHRQHPQQHLIGEREDRRVGADPERQRQDDDGGECGRLGEGAEGVAQIVHGAGYHKVFVDRPGRSTFGRKPRMAAARPSVPSSCMDTLTKNQRRSWRPPTAVLARGADPRQDIGRPLRVRGDLDRHLLPAVLPEPEAAARSCAFLRRARSRPGGRFRACKRCKPDSAICRLTRGSSGSGAPASTSRTSTVTPPWRHWRCVWAAARHLQRNFKRLVGVTPRVRRGGAAAQGQGPAASARRHPGAMLDAGYGSSSRFYERAVPKLGMAPSVYRRGGAACKSATRSSSRRTRRSDGCWWRPRRGGLRRCNGIVGHRADARAGARVSSRRITTDAGALTSGRRRFSRTCPAGGRSWICRSTCRRRRFNGRCGRRSQRFRTGRRGPIPTWRPRSDGRVRCAPSRAPAPPIRSRWRFRVIASCRRRAARAAIVGEWRGRKRC